MKFTPKDIIIGGMGLVAVIALLIGMGHQPQAPQDSQATQTLGGSVDVPGYTVPTVSTSSLITTTSQDILATSTQRTYAQIQNLSTSVTIYCNANAGKKAQPFAGIAITASSTYTWTYPNANLYRGTISCITAAGTASSTSFDK